MSPNLDRDDSNSDLDCDDASRTKKSKQLTAGMEEKLAQEACLGPNIKRTKEDFNFKQKLQKRTKYLKNEIITGMKVEQQIQQQMEKDMEVPK